MNKGVGHGWGREKYPRLRLLYWAVVWLGCGEVRSVAGCDKVCGVAGYTCPPLYFRRGEQDGKWSFI